jgi:hypothetical protein
MTAWLNALVMTAGGGGASGGDGGKQSEHAMQSHFEQWSDLCFSLHQGAQIGRGHVVICAAAQECPRSSRSARALFFASYVDPERACCPRLGAREERRRALEFLRAQSSYGFIRISIHGFRV